MKRMAAISAVFLLSACVEYGLMDPIGPFQMQVPPKTEQTEAPEQTPAEAEAPAAPAPATLDARPPAAPLSAGGPVFRIADLPAEWDGAETAGGIWVALPYLPAYRRVMITDPETGRSVVARLYWRDSTANGDEAVLSSAAAAALGIRPGSAPRIEATVLENE